MHRLNMLMLLSAGIVIFATTTRAVSAEPKETVIYDEAKQGDLGKAGAESPVKFRIDGPGIHVIRGTGTDTLDDEDMFVFEVTGKKLFDFCLQADCAEFKKLKAIDKDGKV